MILESALREFNEDENIRLSVGVLFSFFEEMGAMFNRGIVDKEVIVALFKINSIYYFDLAKPLIDKMRKMANDDTVYEQWETMNLNLNKS